MATQTGSIDLTATNGVKLFAAAGFKTAEQTYATKGELEVTNGQVALRATKTEASQMAQPNLSPFFSSHNTDGTYPDGNADGYWQPSANKLYNRSCFTALDDGWAHLEACDSVQKEFVPPRVDSLSTGDKVTMLVEYRNATNTGSGANFYTRNYSSNVQLTNNWSFITTQTGDGEERHVFTVSSADGQQEWNGLANVTFTSRASSTWTGDIRISFYLGEYTGPYKPYSGDMLYATQAELKVTADGISSEVSKKVNGTEVISAINQSAETVKIQASKVEITGDAVFSAINNDTGTTKISGGKIDATSITIGGSSLATKADVDSIEVGGRNLLAFSSRSSPNPWTSNGLTYTWSSDGWITVAGTCTNTAAALGFTFGSGTQTFQYLPAGTYTLSVESENLLDGTNTYMAVQLGTRTSSDTTKYYMLYDSGSVTGVADLYVSRVSMLLQAAANGKTYNGRIRFKLEKGTKATDWTPAPEDTDASIAEVKDNLDNLEIGGRNLFVSSLASNGYPTDKAVGAQYGITGMSANHEAYQLVPVEEGASYIFQYWVDDSAHPGWVCIQLLDEDGLVVSKLARVYPQADYWTKAFTVPSGVTTALISGRHLAVGFSYANLKFEKGTKPTDWTPAPEDVAADISAVQSNLNAARSWYAESDSAAGEVKTATITPATTGFSQAAGTVVFVNFTYTNTLAAGSLTLSVNGAAALPIKTIRNGALSNIAAVGQIAAGGTYQFVCDGTNWVMSENYNDSGGINNARYRTQYANAIKAAAAITSGRVICGTSAGYKNIAASVEFDLDYPLLYASAAIAAGSTGSGNYLTMNAVNAKSNATVQGVATNKMVYLKGTVTGNTFKIAASNFLTCTVPNSADGFVYIPLGIAYDTTPNIYFSSNKDLYAYVDGAFGPVSIREASAAAKTATNYISADSTGIKIANANPATATTYQHLTATSTEFVVDGDSMLELDGTNGARVGKEDGINTCVGSGGFYIRDSNDIRAGFEYEAASESSPGSTTIESSDGLKLYGNVSSIDGTETGMAFIWLSGALNNRDSEQASVDIVANSDPDNSSGDGIGSHVASIFLDGGNTSGDSLSSGEPRVAIHVGKESFEIGKPTSLYSTGSVSVANSSWVKVAQLTIPSTGTWLVVLSGDFASDATGRRVVACARGAVPSSAPSYDSQNSLAMAPANGANTKFSSSAIIDFTAGDVYYAAVWQNSGGALTTRIMIKAVRLI